MNRPASDDIEDTQTYRAAMRALIAARWRAVWEAIPIAVEGSDPEGVHNVRVASRRLRAAMDVAVEAFPAVWYKPLHRIAKEITGELGEVRDRDVMLEYLQKERAAAPEAEWAGIDRLIARLTSEREAARAEMVAYLADLEARGIVDETVTRFGQDASPAQAAQAMDERSE